MAVNFSELLNANRLRPLWGTGQQPPAEEDPEAQKRKDSLDGDADDPAQAGKGAKQADLKDDAPLEPLLKESPLQLLNKLEMMLRMVLGPKAMMLSIYLAPLHRALSDIEGVKRIPHPLQQALVTQNLPTLIYRLEDSIRALLRTQQRYLG